MTEKEIIIDGVNVTWCKNLKPNLDCADSAYHLFDMTTRWAKCEIFKDCYYKQLQRKEQENEELKEKLLKTSGELFNNLSVVEDMAILLGLDKKDHFKITKCYYKVKANKQV